MKKLLYLIVFIIFSFFALTLYFKNPDSIEVNYYFNINWHLPLFWLIMTPFFVGMILGVLVMSLSVFKNKRKAGKTQRDLAKVEKEVQSLRAMPIKDET